MRLSDGYSLVLFKKRGGFKLIRKRIGGVLTVLFDKTKGEFDVRMYLK